MLYYALCVENALFAVVVELHQYILFGWGMLAAADQEASFAKHVPCAFSTDFL